MKTKVLLMAVVGLAVAGVFADTKDIGVIEATGFTWNKTKLVLGEWTGSDLYDDALGLAKEKGIPLIAFFGRRSCGNCKGLERKLVTDEAKAWFAKRKFILLCGIEGETFASKVTKLSRKGSTLPFVGLYWDKNGDGVSDGKGGEVNNADARKGGAWCKSTQDFIDWVESYFKDYISYDGGKFAASESEYDRMECEEGTGSVPVELVRESASTVASNTVVAVYPDGKVVTNTVSWAVGDTNKVVDIEVEAEHFSADGEQVEIVVYSSEGEAMGTNHITYVERENSAANPLWKTERTDPYANGEAPALAFGEWTMDLAAAKHLAEQKGGYTLVSVQGSLWCPDCANTDRNFLDLKASPDDKKTKLQAWAESNKVALVTVDIQNYGGPKATPCLLSRRSAASTLARVKEDEYLRAGADAALTNAIVRSGLGYQTRKGISEAEAIECLEAFHGLVTANTDAGGFHRPEDSNANRTGVPIFVLLRSDGTVAARFTRFASASPMKYDTNGMEIATANYDVSIKRFDEMLAIAAGSGDHADVAEIENNYPGDGSVQLAANGGVVTNELSHVDQRDTFKLTGFAGNGDIKVTARGDSTLIAKLSLWRRANGATSPIQLLSSVEAEAKLSDGVTLEYPADKLGEYFVQVEAKSVATKSEPELEQPEIASTNAAETFIAYELTSKVSQLVPTASAATASAPADTNVVTMALEQDAVYRLVGLDFLSEANSNALEWVTGGDGLLFKAKAGGTAELFLAENGGKITYQKWVPGTVGFKPVGDKAEVTAPENEDVTVSYRRAGGSSGSVTVKVSLNLDETDFFYDWAPEAEMKNKEYPRFRINGLATNEWSETVEWPDDGRDLASCVSNILVTAGEFEDYDVAKYYGPGKVVFDLEIVEQTEAGVFTNTVDYGRFTINFTETSPMNAGQAAIVGADREWAKPFTVYACADEEVAFKVGRIGGSCGPVYAEVEPSDDEVSVTSEDGGYQLAWSNRATTVKTVTVTNLPPAGKSVKLTLKSLTTGFKVDSSAKAITIVSVATNAPAFETSFASETLYRYVAVSNVYAVTGAQGGELSFAKLSGKLPKGLKAVWNKSVTNPALLVTGVPTDKNGASYSAVYQVTEKRGKTKVPGLGLTITLDFKVVDPAVAGAGPEGKEPLNDSCVKSRTFKDLMILEEKEDGTVELFGTLQLTLPPTGKASAKLLCDEGKVSFAAKSWSALNASSGEYSCVLVGKGKFTDWELDVEAKADKSISVTLSIAEDNVSVPIEHNGILWSADNPATDCVGYYTVTFAAPEKGPDITGDGKAYAAEGSAYLALTMAKSAAKTGTMKWAGALPNGTKVSGSSVLSPATNSNDVLVLLPVFKSASKDVFAGALRIVRGAADREGKDCWETVDAPEVDGKSVLTRWTHTEKSKVTKKGDFTVRYIPYGGIYDADLDLGCCCENEEEGRGTTNMTLTVELPATKSDVYGAFAAVEPIDLKVKSTGIVRDDPSGGANRITLSFKRSTGVVSGKFDLYYGTEDKKLSATYQGVVQLGFGNGCGCGEGVGLPFVNGFWYVKDKLTADGTTKTISVKRGGKLVIDVPVIDAPGE